MTIRRHRSVSRCVDAKANAARQSGYNSCPTCAQIDILKSLPSGLTTYAPGQGFAVTGK